MEDKKAIELLKRDPNNPKAIEYLYKKYALEVIKFITYKGANPEIAEEIFQEAFLVALDHIQRYEDNSFTNWIKTISYNLYKDYLRKLTTELNKNKDKNKDKENIEGKREKALKDAVITLENGIKNTQFSYLGKKQDIAREGREIHITTDEMQTYIDNHNKSIEGWHDAENVSDPLSMKDIQDCVKNAFAKFAKDGSRNQDDRAYVLSLLYSDVSLDDIAKKINRTYAATKVFISETKKKFIPYSRPCFELLKD